MFRKKFNKMPHITKNRSPEQFEKWFITGFGTDRLKFPFQGCTPPTFDKSSLTGICLKIKFDVVMFIYFMCSNNKAPLC